MNIFIAETDLEQTKNCFEFKGPEIDITKCNYLAVSNLYIEFAGPRLTNCLVDLTSTLIDKSVENPNQIICSCFVEKSNHLWFTPTHLEEFKIQCSSLQESLFGIKFSAPEGKRKIKNLRLTIKFSECRDSVRL